MHESCCKLLNARTIGTLADLFLSHLGLDKATLPYRRLKNAVILSALRFDAFSELYAALAEAEDVTPSMVKQSLRDTVTKLDPPADKLFNAEYCKDAEVGFMPHFDKAEEVISFLGKTFLYILETNYPEYRFAYKITANNI